MKKARCWIVLMGLLLISASTSDAQVFFEIKPELDPNRPANRHERLNFAKALRKRIDQMHEAIPNLSPFQEKWLKSAMSAKDSFRALKASESDEYYLQDIKNRLKSILTALTIVIEGKPKGQRYEVLAWLSVADAMMHYDFSSGIGELVNRGLANFGDDRFGMRDVMLITFGSIGRSILWAMIRPYIAEILPE